MGGKLAVKLITTGRGDVSPRDRERAPAMSGRDHCPEPGCTWFAKRQDGNLREHRNPDTGQPCPGGGNPGQGRKPRR